VAGLGSAAASAYGSHRASRAQRDAATRAMDLQREVYGQQRQDQAPWLQAGQATLADLLQQMRSGGFDTQYQQMDPSQLANDQGFQFRMAEGQKALERSAAARGGLNGGGMLKSLARYSQGVASDEYGNAWNRNHAQNVFRQGEGMNRYNRMAGIAGMGQASAQNLGAFGSHHADSMSGLQGAYGNAQAAGAMGVARGVGSAFNTIGDLAMLKGGFGGGGGGIPTQSGSTGYRPSFGFGLNYGDE
jgi:hypothetical protein